MTRLENHLQKIKSRLTAYFDCEEKKRVGNYFWDLVAVSHRDTQRFFLQKHWVIDDYRVSEIHLYKIIPGKLSDREWGAFKEALLQAALERVTPGFHQMETLVYGIILTGQLPEEQLIREIRTFRKRKNFLLGIKGWLILQTALVVPDANQVVVRKSLKHVENLIK
ncbi:MAG: hypothetical protein GXO76_09315 [Calditrichaeota bacterium]|nr:hypothetical protein [Calditrichota bacterium]